jgi:5-methylcytosine-specific restriction endonuclease McrA
MTKIAAPVGRSVTEWIGKTPDSMPPPSVELRILRRYKNRCYLSGVHIGAKAWHVEHIKPLWLGGDDKECNMAPAHIDCHAPKTKGEATERAKVTRQSAAHLGAATSKQPIASHGFA